MLGAALVAVALAAPAARAESADVAALQVALRAHGLYGATIDGERGPLTTAGVRRFPARPGVVGWDVAGLQFLLGRQGFPTGGVDGGLGPRTDAALRRFQSWAGLGADGLAGPATPPRPRRPPPTSPPIFA